MSTASEIGKIIGNSISEQSVIKENLSADDADNQLNVISSFDVVIDGKLIITKKTYDPESFVIDHPVQGELDSSVFVIDGGYLNGGLMFPITFPLSFNDGSEVVYTEEF